MQPLKRKVKNEIFLLCSNHSTVPEKSLIDKDTILNPSYLELTFICESLKHYTMTFYLFTVNMPINRCLIISINIRWTLIAMIIHRLTGRFSGYVQEIRCYNAYVLTILGAFLQLPAWRGACYRPPSLKIVFFIIEP